jgi:hypothetical protein
LRAVAFPSLGTARRVCYRCAGAGEQVSATEVTADEPRENGQPVDDGRARETLVTIGLAVALGAACWGRRLTAGLTLDEAGTWWVIRDDWRAAVERALRVQGQSPFYYLLEWGVASLIGHREVALRLLSVVCIAGCVPLLLALGRRWFGVGVGELAVLFFVSCDPAIMAAATARPYALALLCCLGATTVLDRWLARGGPPWLLSYVGLTLAMIYAHYMFATALLVHAILVGQRPPLTRCRAGALGGGALIGPAQRRVRDGETGASPPPCGQPRPSRLAFFA